MNNWEGRSRNFLSKVFDKDSDDIVEYIKMSKATRIAEVGFGNNRLLPKILSINKDIQYFGFDKTKTFVDRAAEEFGNHRVKFALINLECPETITEIVETANPEILILRYVLEHLPSYSDVLESLNNSGINSILISLHTKMMEDKTWIEMREGYTFVYMKYSDMSKALSNYSIETMLYEGVPHTFHIAKKIQNLDLLG